MTDPDPAHVRALANLIWDISRADEGSISATGADVIAKAILTTRDSGVLAALEHALRPHFDPPVVWYVDPDGIRPPFLPYSGGYPTGSYEAASAVACINRGWRAIPMTVTPKEE